jgi:hypothetical protein
VGFLTLWLRDIEPGLRRTCGRAWTCQWLWVTDFAIAGWVSKVKEDKAVWRWLGHRAEAAGRCMVTSSVPRRSLYVVWL